MDLDMATCEELIQELATRYSALVIVGAHREDPSNVTEVIEGPAYMCVGLLAQIHLELTASMEHPIE